MKQIKLYVTLLLFFMTTTIFAETAEQQLDALLSSFKSMSANFAQTAIVKQRVAKSSSGTMALQRPGKFRWEITAPNHQLIVADGKNLWIYDVDLEQATKQSLTKDKHSPAILLSGSTAALKDRFKIVHATSQGNKMQFDLEPKNNQDMVERVELQFINQKLSQMSVIDNLGQKNIFSFSNVNVNPTLANKLFQFHPPKGVDVIVN